MAFDCDCIQLNIFDGKTAVTAEIFPSGTFNGQPFWYYQLYPSLGLFLFWSVDRWYVNDVLGQDFDFYAQLQVNGCPFGVFEMDPRAKFTFSVLPCGSCKKYEDRTQKKYNAIRLPEIFEEQNRGYFRCCCPFNVLADGSSNSWANDITSAWIKLSGPGDTASAILYKNGIPTNYVPDPQPFVNEPNAFYWTIPWKEVLALDGAGCYELKISYDISGIVQDFTWGIYTLKPYTIQNALKTARLRVIFDSQQEIEGINFSGSQVEDSIRFFGYIGNRQPNTEIDNLIYQNREVKKVVRENLNTYEILTDPTCEEHIKKLTDLYLLSENQLFISDYNAHNHSYRYLDIPAIVQESPEITYFDFSREASLKCIVGDKFKNKRSFYK
jgi:hypothetical protein